MEPDQAANNQAQRVADLRDDMTRLPPSLKIAVVLSHMAGKEDKEGKYGRAIKLYREAERHILYAIEHDAKEEGTKEELRQAFEEYRDRALELSYIDEMATNTKHKG